MSRVRGLCPFAWIALAAWCGCTSTGQTASWREPIRVAAASDLSFALRELARLFELEQGRQVVLSFGSTGMLARQLREGAPFDMFAAASKRYVDEVVQASVCDGSTRAPYGRGRLALLACPRTVARGLVPRNLEELTAASCWGHRAALTRAANRRRNVSFRTRACRKPDRTAGLTALSARLTRDFAGKLFACGPPGG